MSYTLYYWGACKKFWGRCVPIVLALDHAGVQYAIVDRDEELLAKSKSFAVPMVTFDDGHSMAQLPMIMDVLGERLHLQGKNRAEVIATKQGMSS